MNVDPGRKDVWVFNLEHPDENDFVFHWTVYQDPPELVQEFCSPITIAHLSADGLPWVVVGASYARHYGYLDCPMRDEFGNCAQWQGFPDPDCHGYDWNESGDCYHWESMIHAWRIDGNSFSEYHSDLRRTQRLTTDLAGHQIESGLTDWRVRFLWNLGFTCA